METLISTTAASELLGVPEDTLRRWRSRGLGPTFIAGSERGRRRVFYRPSDLAKWQEERRVTPRNDPLLHPKEVAHILGVHTKTLETWRRTGKGPPFVKTGGTMRAVIRYKEADVIAWREQRTRRPKEVKMQHDRDYWRSCSTARLIEEGRNNPTTELCIALAERLEDEVIEPEY